MTEAQKRRIAAAGLTEAAFEPQGGSAARIRELEEENARLGSLLETLVARYHLDQEEQE